MIRCISQTRTNKTSSNDIVLSTSHLLSGATVERASRFHYPFTRPGTSRLVLHLGSCGWRHSGHGSVDSPKALTSVLWDAYLDMEAGLQDGSLFMFSRSFHRVFHSDCTSPCRRFPGPEHPPRHPAPTCQGSSLISAVEAESPCLNILI